MIIEGRTFLAMSIAFASRTLLDIMQGISGLHSCPSGVGPIIVHVLRRSMRRHRSATYAAFVALLKVIEKDRTALPQQRDSSRIEFGISLLKVIRVESVPLPQ